MNLVDLLFPRNCLGCGRGGQYICSICISKLPRVDQLCPVCEKASIDGVTHVRCLKKQSIDGVYSLWPYQGVIRSSILKLKYKFATQIAEELSDFAFSVLKDTPIFPEKSVFTPIPLYWIRKNFRGFNQSEIIGKRLAEKMDWDFDPDILYRRKFGRPQTELRGKDRRKNVRGVFCLNPKYKLLSTSYILFDDVYTTGSTLKEAGKVLKRNGVEKVWGLTIAR